MTGRGLDPVKEQEIGMLASNISEHLDHIENTIIVMKESGLHAADSDGWKQLLDYSLDILDAAEAAVTVAANAVDIHTAAANPNEISLFDAGCG